METENPGTKLFPADFMWGASTSSHQVEGGNYNQWTVWELEHASELAKNAAKRIPNSAVYTRFDQLPNWDDIKHEAEDPNNYISGRGVDHYNRYQEDFDLLKKLNLNSFRFGIEWSRIEPKEGEWDQEAVDHYRNYINELKERGVTPMVNLWHWTMPTWLAEKGGFEKRANLKYWKRFIDKVADEYGGIMHYVITINEPNVYTSFSYILGLWPPQKRNPLLLLNVSWNVIKAHRYAYKKLKKTNPYLKIGMAQQLANIQAKRPHNMLDELSTKLMRYVWNWWFFRRTRKQQDFIGFNYYFTDYYTGVMERHDPAVPINDLGWYMEPEGLYPLLMRVWSRAKGKPIIITENGLPDAEDKYRRWWIEESIVAMERALSEGVNLRGYYHWSLLDNFEWDNGWWPKFGLVEVDRAHDMKRTIRPSAKWFAERIEKLKE